MFRALATIVIIIRALTHHHQSSHHLTTTMTSEQAAPLFVLFRPREKVELHITETPQFSQIVSPYDALEEPVPIDDQALGPTIMLLAPP